MPPMYLAGDDFTLPMFTWFNRSVKSGYGEVQFYAMVDQAAAALDAIEFNVQCIGCTDAIEFNVLVAQCRIVSTLLGKSIRVGHNKENTMLGSSD